MAGQAFDLSQLVEIAEELRDLGVAEFSIGDICVKFGGPVQPRYVAQPLEDNTHPPEPRPTTILQVAEKMWGPVKFPGS